MTHVALVTGCLGFLGQHLTRTLLQRGDVVYGVDAETYAADLRARDGVLYTHARCEALTHLPDVDVVYHCAAETHVDNSLTDADVFLRSNVLGTHRLLDLLRGKRASKAPRLVHVSTDEVFGPSHFPRTPEDRLNPRNPYAASKAAAEHLVTAYASTYGLETMIVRMTNLYGTGQYPEKLIPRAVRRISRGMPMPVHGDGTAKRSWLSVEDAVAGLLLLAERGQPGAVYHLGGNTTTSVREIVQAIGGILQRNPLAVAVGQDAHGEFEYQRSGMDINYQLDDSGSRALGWHPTGDFYRDLQALVPFLVEEPYR